MAIAPTRPSRELTVADLPDGFVIGTATAAAQIEGAATAGGKGRSIWDALTLVPGAIAGGVGPEQGCDHWHRWESDLDLLADLGVDAYRFSISWPRIQPNGVGPALSAGLDFYDRLVDGMLERGIAPNATLYHWDLPAALEDDLGGWRHRDVAGRFADYATLVAERLADRVRWWGTLNEPWCSAFLGYQAGAHAPGVQDEAGSVRAAHHLLLGHGLAVQALRAAGASDIGIVLNLNDTRPGRDRDADHEAVRRVDGTQNRYWLGTLAGHTPDDVVESFGDLLELEELVLDGDAEVQSEPLDWLGVNNYYPEIVVAGDDPANRPAGPGLDGIEIVHPAADAPGNMMNWHIDPTGITAAIRLAASFLPDTPIYVTENGIPLPDVVGSDGAVDDPARIAYLTDHLSGVLEARADGVDVRGYYVWSAMDNFEWAWGYGPRFGVIHVDYATMERTPKNSYRWLADLLAQRG